MRSLLLLAALTASPAFAADGEAVKMSAELPVKAQELRDAGVDADQVKMALDAAKGAKMAPGELATVFGEMAPMVKEKGSMEEPGKFLKEKIEEGLRGEDLSKAVKEGFEGGGKTEAASAKPEPTTKPTPRPTPSGGGGRLVRPGNSTGKIGKGKGGKRKNSAGGKLTRPGGAK